MRLQLKHICCDYYVAFARARSFDTHLAASIFPDLSIMAFEVPYLLSTRVNLHYVSFINSNLDFDVRAQLFITPDMPLIEFPISLYLRLSLKM